LDDELKGWRECYRHPKKPAIRDCSCCGRPICKECESESGNPALCAPCKESLSPVEEKPVAGKRLELLDPIPERDAKVVVTELTILDGGKVRPPEEHVAWKEEESKPGAAAVIPGATEEPGKEPEPLPQAPPAGNLESEKSLEEAATAEPPKKAPPLKKKAPLPEAGMKAAGKAHRKEKAPRKKRLSTAAGKAGRFTRRLLATGTLGQLINGLPYALAAGVVVFGSWLLLALIGGQWSQFAVVTCGMVVPWTFFKGTTARKRGGVRVWPESPRPIWTSILSVIIVAGLTPPVLFLAYKILYRSNTRLPFSDFMERYFMTSSWILVIAGLALAFLIPFLLKAGENWRKPSIMNRGKKGKSPDE